MHWVWNWEVKTHGITFYSESQNWSLHLRRTSGDESSAHLSGLQPGLPSCIPIGLLGSLLSCVWPQGSTHHLDLIGSEKILKQHVRKITIKIIMDSLYLNPCKYSKCFDDSIAWQVYFLELYAANNLYLFIISTVTFGLHKILIFKIYTFT